MTVCGKTGTLSSRERLPYMTVCGKIGILSSREIILYITVCGRTRQQSSRERILYTRGIWKVLSMVFYLSNRFTNPIMFDIILKNPLSSMLWYKFREDIVMQTQIILL